MSSSFEYSIRYRFLDENGHPTAVRSRYFATALATHEFLAKLDSVDSRQAISISIAKREIGTWQHLDRLALQADAADEGGGR